MRFYKENSVVWGYSSAGRAMRSQRIGLTWVNPFIYAVRRVFKKSFTIIITTTRKILLHLTKKYCQTDYSQTILSYLQLNFCICIFVYPLFQFVFRNKNLFANLNSRESFQLCKTISIILTTLKYFLDVFYCQ